MNEATKDSTDAPELKPRLFCGGDADLMVPECDDVSLAVVMCMSCYSLGKETLSDNQATTAWNTRIDQVLTVKPLEWDWIGNRHAFGKISGFSYEILRVKPSAQHPISNPPDISKQWRGKDLGYGKGAKYLGHEWFETSSDAMAARQSEHDTRILSAITTQPAAETITLADQVAEERKACALIADNIMIDMMGATLTGLPEQARLRESMANTAEKIRIQINARSANLTVKEPTRPIKDRKGT